MPLLRVTDTRGGTAELFLSRETLENNRGVLEALAADDADIELRLADVGFPEGTCSDFMRAVRASYPTDPRRGLRRAHAMREVLACKNTAPALSDMIDWLGTPFAGGYARGQMLEDIDGSSLFARATTLLTTSAGDPFVNKISREYAAEAANTGDIDALDVCTVARGGFCARRTCALFERAASHGHLDLAKALFADAVTLSDNETEAYVLGAFSGALEGGHMPVVLWLWGLDEQRAMRPSWFGDAGTPEAFDWLEAQENVVVPQRNDPVWEQHALQNRVWAIERLVAKVGFPDDADIIDTMVKVAARGGHVGVLEALAANGVTNFGARHFTVALHCGHVAVLDFFDEQGMRLIEQGVFVELEDKCMLRDSSPTRLVGIEWAIRKCVARGGDPLNEDLEGGRLWVSRPHILLFAAFRFDNTYMVRWLLERFAGPEGLFERDATVDYVRVIFDHNESLETLKVLDEFGLVKDNDIKFFCGCVLGLDDTWNARRQKNAEDVVEWLWSTKPWTRDPSVAKRIFFEKLENVVCRKPPKSLDWVVRKFGIEVIPKARDHRHLLQASRSEDARGLMTWVWTNLYSDEERTAVLNDPSVATRLPRMPRVPRTNVKVKRSERAEGDTKSKRNRA